MKTFEQVKKVFGFKDKEPSLIALDLAISSPCMKAREILKVFNLAILNYHTKEDEIEDNIAWVNRKFSGKNMLQIQEEYDPNENYHSTYIFRNLHRVINQSKEWTEEISREYFILGLEKTKNKIFKDLKKNYRDQRKLSLFEIVCEFIDLVKDVSKKGI